MRKFITCREWALAGDLGKTLDEDELRRDSRYEVRAGRRIHVGFCRRWWYDEFVVMILCSGRGVWNLIIAAK